MNVTPTPSPTPVPVVTKAPVPAPTDDPVPAPTDAPVPAPTDAPVVSGVNGDPLIMGLQGQLFRFDGRNGAWYSATSGKPNIYWCHNSGRFLQ
jgi:hypothetical protein